MDKTCIVIENEKFKLEIGSDATAKSLIIKSNGKECLDKSVALPMFSITELRPYNNEIKLAYPNVKMEFNAKDVNFDGENLIISFELVTFKAVVKVINRPTYIEFKFVDFIVDKNENADLSMDYPPVEEFRILQLPVKNLKNFGDWLNVMHDDEIAVNVLGTSAHPLINNVKEQGYTILYADARRGIKLKGCSAILVATEKQDFLDVIDTIEQDYNLPCGVRSRKSKDINRSIMWSLFVYPDNVDEYIAYAKKGGFTKMLLYYPCMFKEEGYRYCNSFEYNEKYPNKEEDVKYVLKKFNDAGIDVGIHFLHTHIGIKTKYMTPEVDHRINIKQRYTLSKPLKKTDDKIFVEENPEWAPMHEQCRILNFNGELIRYEGYSTEYPYYFYGLERGYNDTFVKDSPCGLSGGIVDISEYSAISAYINQNSDLQDEVAIQLSKLYNLGFKFVYFDGSEGTSAPFDYNIANAQYRVYKRFNESPLFCEGAAKTHFSWHMLSGGNAFDVFPFEVFKQKIAQFPLEEAERMKNDFTRINFGWWLYDKGAQADYYEYGSSKAFSYDCPITLMKYTENILAREDDIFEVLRRWEHVRNNNLITTEQKEMLKNPDKEYILLINEKDQYELQEYTEIKLEKDCPIRAFYFMRNNRSYVIYWHKDASGKVVLPLDLQDVILEEELGKVRVEIEKVDGNLIIPADNRKYLSTTVPVKELIKAFENAKFQ